MERHACYMQEYKTVKGIAARLRDKKSNKKIVICTADEKLKMKFLKFLSAAKEQSAVMPTLYDIDGSDVVAV